MHTGKVLVISGSGNDPDNKNLQAAVWDPVTLTVRTFTISWDMFCSGMVILLSVAANEGATFAPLAVQWRCELVAA
jgi:hypothetical protein